MPTTSVLHSVLARLAALVLFLFSAAPVAQAQVGQSGRVMDTADPIRIALDDGQRAPLGAAVYTFRVETAGGREVGVQTGAYRAFKKQGSTLYAVPRRGASAPSTEAGDLVEVTAGEAGLLTLLSQPEGASVTWKGRLLGQTPTTLEVAAGTHVFTFAAEGYDPEETNVIVEAGRIQSFQISLTPPPRASWLYTKASRAFFGGDYAEAEREAGRALAVRDDGTLSEAQVAKLPHLHAAAEIGVGVASRAEALGLEPAELNATMSKVLYIHENRDNLRAVTPMLAELEPRLTLDPSWPAIRALVPTPPAGTSQ